MDSTETNHAELLPQPSGLDWFLQTLVQFANQSNAGMGITLNVGGMLVSGILMGGLSYFEGFADDFASAFEDTESAERVRALFASFGDFYKDNSADKPDPQFIHLKDARFFHASGAPIPANRGVWWRGRISEVAGFSLGLLASE